MQNSRRYPAAYPPVFDYSVTGESAAGLRFSDAIAIVRRNLGLIALIAALGTGAAVASLSFLEERYASTAMLVLERSDTQVLQAVGAMERQDRDRTSVQTEIDTMRSRSFLGDVVDRLSLTADRRFNPYWKGEDGEGPGVVGRALASVTSLLDDNSEAGSANQAEQTAPASAQRHANTHSASLSDATIEEGASDAPAAARDMAIATLRGTLAIARQNVESLALTVTVRTSDPVQAARIANGVAETYVAATLEDKESATRKTIQFLEERAAQLALEITTAEREIAAYSQTNQLTNSTTVDLLGSQLVDTNAQLTQARVALAEKEARFTRIRELIDGDAQSAGAILTSTMLAELRGDRARLERERAELGLTYAQQHPQMQNKVAEIASIDGLIENEIRRVLLEFENEIEVARSRVTKLTEELALLESGRRERDVSEIEMRQLERKVEAKRLRQQAILTSLGELERQVEVLSPGATIVSEAEVPLGPYFPRPKLIVAGGFAGSLALAFICVLMVEGFDDRIRSGHAMQRRHRIQHFGYVPNSKDRAVRRAGGLLNFMSEEPQSALEESLRSVLWRCSQAGGGRGDGRRQVVLITSAGPGDGKSFVSLALAATAAITGRRTLLVDFDLRRSGIAALLESKRSFWKRNTLPEFGLEEYLFGECALEDITRPAELIENLDIISNGRKQLNRNAAFYSDRLLEFFEDLGEEYDLVIVDTPPAIIVNEAVELSDFADVVLLVARWGRTREAELVALLERFGERNPHTLGLVVNGVRRERHHYYEPGGVAADYSGYAKSYLKV